MPTQVCPAGLLGSSHNHGASAPCPHGDLLSGGAPVFVHDHLTDGFYPLLQQLAYASFLPICPSKVPEPICLLCIPFHSHILIAYFRGMTFFF